MVLPFLAEGRVPDETPLYQGISIFPSEDAKLIAHVTSRFNGGDARGGGRGRRGRVLLVQTLRYMRRGITASQRATRSSKSCATPQRFIGGRACAALVRA